jgi:hypothetical protein
MLEIFQLMGAIVAFAAGAFLVWDRWARGRPLVVPTIKLAGVNPYKYIRIKNPGPGDVFVLGVRAYPPGIYGIAKDHSTDAILQATTPKIYGVADLQVLLPPGEKCDLPIIDLRKNEDAPSRRVRFVISWRKTSSSWLWQVPAGFTIATRDLARMAAAADREHAERVR